MSESESESEKSNLPIDLKLILIGSSAVGKTSFCNRIKDQDFYDTQPSTIGVDFHIVNVNIIDQLYKLQVWDTAGHERYNSITTAYYRGTDIAILCFDLTNRKSLNDLRMWANEIKQEAGENIVLFLIGMKSDLESNFTDEEIVYFMMEYRILSYKPISSKTSNTNFHDLLSNFISKYRIEVEERNFIQNKNNTNTKELIDVKEHTANFGDVYDIRKCCYIS